MKLPKPPIVLVELIARVLAERRELQPFGRGPMCFHITLWGDSAPKVLIEVNAGNQRRAEQFALAWGRCRWWRDARTIGIERVELISA